MRRPTLSQHLDAVEDGYRDAAREAVQHADPSWYAYRGYRRGAGDFDGAGHLAWERVAVRMAELRRVEGARGGRLCDRQIAFVLGYGLGHRDAGRASRADIEELLGVLCKPADARLRIWRSSRFWLFCSLLLVFELSMVGAAEVDGPDYPVLTARLFPRACAGTPAADERIEPVDDASLLDVVTWTAAGTVPLQKTIAFLRQLPKEKAIRLAEALLGVLDAKGRKAVLGELGRMPGGEAACLLRAALRDQDGSVVEAALSSLVGQGDPGSTEEVAQLLRHEEAATRRAAAEALGVLAPASEAWRLVDALLDPEPDVRLAVRRALTQAAGADLGPEPRAWWRRLRPEGK